MSCTIRAIGGNRKQLGYWKNKENIDKFLLQIKQRYNLNTAEDWNSISQKHIKSNGGNSLLSKYSMFEIKCMACPEGKYLFNQKQSAGYWENKENILQFLSEIQQKYNLNTPEDWNSISQEHIKSNGGLTLLSKHKYSMYELKCMACPEGKYLFNPKQSAGYWENQENIHQFLSEIQQKYNLNTPEDWNKITTKHIKLDGGFTLLKKYSMYELKCMACPEGKYLFNQNQSAGYWENHDHFLKFISDLQQQYKLSTPEDWNTLTQKMVRSKPLGNSLLKKYSIFEIKCLACPEGKPLFKNPNQSPGYWENKENILQFLSEIQQKYNLNTPEDWNSITLQHIQENGGCTLMSKFSMYELKCMACPEGKLIFNPKQSSEYWEDKENILKFLCKLKQLYNLNTPEDWNSITHNQIQSNGGGGLLKKYSMFELKCLACPEGKSIFNNPKQRTPLHYWDDESNRNLFFENLKSKYNLQTPQDWKRISRNQIISQGGGWLFNDKHLQIKIQFECPTNENEATFIPLRELLSNPASGYKRSSQRWLFLQIQKIFPHDEIVEDYFHPEISRKSGFTVQFDVYLTNKRIAFEYHGKQHYEDIPQAFSNVETYKHRDLEKEKLCKQYGICLIVIPYWWDNKLDSLRTFLYSKINL